ncbi:MAG: FAD-dependent oxidoreductase [Steroidobacteraceae bacterium]
MEAGPRLLPAFAPNLSAYALKALARLGVEVRLGSPVTDCNSRGVRIGEQIVEADVVLWAAGVRKSRAAKQHGAHVARTVKQRLAGNSSSRPFRYRHAGDLATIGNRKSKSQDRA